MLLGVLALHLALVVVLLASSGRVGEPAAQRPAPRSTVRFIPPSPTLRSPAAPAQRPERSPAARRIDTLATPRPETPTTDPASRSSDAITAPAISATTPPQPAASAPPPPSLLDTDASKRAIREAAGARRGEWQPNAPLTPEAKMAKTFGDPRLVEEDLGGGRRRYWQNGRCSESTESRASKLFPEDTLPKPRLVGACP